VLTKFPSLLKFDFTYSDLNKIVYMMEHRRNKYLKGPTSLLAIRWHQTALKLRLSKTSELCAVLFLNENEIRKRYSFSVTKSHFEVHCGYNYDVIYNFAVVVDRYTLHVFPDFTFILAYSIRQAQSLAKCFFIYASSIPCF
jgi:hypothetical protein